MSDAPTWVEGIGPPLEQLANDYAGEAWAPDFFALVGEIKRLRAGLEGLLDVAERTRGGDPSLDPEEWYAIRDYARKVLSL